MALCVCCQLARHNKILQNLLKPLKKNKEGEEGISSMVNIHPAVTVMMEQLCIGLIVMFVCLQLNLNNRPLSQMLKSTAPAAVVEQDPLEYYEQLTAQIEVRLLLMLMLETRLANMSSIQVKLVVSL